MPAGNGTPGHCKQVSTETSFLRIVSKRFESLKQTAGDRTTRNIADECSQSLDQQGKLACSEGYVGCTFKEKSGKLVVDSVWDGGPAAASDKIGKGDEIIAITSIGVRYPLLGRSVKNLVEPLSGPPGTSVTLHMIPTRTTVPVDILLRRKRATKTETDILSRNSVEGDRLKRVFVHPGAATFCWMPARDTWSPSFDRSTAN